MPGHRGADARARSAGPAAAAPPTHTTRPGTGRWRAPDLVRRRFAAEGLNRRWYGDGTEIATDEGKLFLASVLDMGSRRIVGFALSEHHDAERPTRRYPWRSRSAAAGR
jgi:transposase InsO family protein